MTVRELPTCALTYDLEIDIEAVAPTVWAAMVDDTNAWWLPDFHMVATDSTVTLDARAGGLLVEHQSGGGSLTWYQVQHCVPGEALHMVGHLSPDWGGPATTMLSLTLEPKGDTTTLRIRDALVGAVNADTAGSLESGWGQLFADGLKAHVESR